MEPNTVKKECDDAKSVPIQSKRFCTQILKNNFSGVISNSFEKMTIEEMSAPGGMSKLLERMKTFHEEKNSTAILYYLTTLLQIEPTIINASSENLLPLLNKIHQNKNAYEDDEIVKMVTFLRSNLIKYIKERDGIDSAMLSTNSQENTKDITSSTKRRHKPVVSLGRHRLTGLYGENDNLAPSPVKCKKPKRSNFSNTQTKNQSTGSINSSIDFSNEIKKKTTTLDSKVQNIKLSSVNHCSSEKNIEFPYVIPTIDKSYIGEIPLSYSYINPVLYKMFVEHTPAKKFTENIYNETSEYAIFINLLSAERSNKSKGTSCKDFPQKLDDHTILKFQSGLNNIIEYELNVSGKTKDKEETISQDDDNPSSFFEKLKASKGSISLGIRDVLDKLRKEGFSK